jgi:hypothetical protein
MVPEPGDAPDSGASPGADGTTEGNDRESVLPETIHGRSLAGTVLMAGLVAVTVRGGQLAGPAGVGVGLLFPLYFALGVYRPLRDRLPYYDQWLGVPLVAYGLYLVSVAGQPLLGVLFAAFGVVVLSRAVGEWDSAPDARERE